MIGFFGIIDYVGKSRMSFSIQVDVTLGKRGRTKRDMDGSSNDAFDAVQSIQGFVPRWIGMKRNDG